jgi:hypothetical protein
MIKLEYPEGATPIDPDEAGGLLLTHVTKRREIDGIRPHLKKLLGC